MTLSSKTSLTLDQSEEELFNRFTEFSIWAGRYPVPKHYPKMKPEENDYGHKIGKHYTITRLMTSKRLEA